MVLEKGCRTFFGGLLSYFSLIWLHKTAFLFLFFQKNKELQADYYYFTEVRDMLFFSTNSVVRLFFLNEN